MKNSLFFGIVCLMLIITIFEIVSAAPAAPSPTCKITGEITNVTFRSSYFQEDNGLPCNFGGRNVTSSYLLSVKINDLSTVREDGDYTCENIYPVDSKVSLILNFNYFFMDANYSIGKIIEGEIHFGGDECSSGTYLYNHTLGDNNSGNCNNLYWFDNDNKSCEQKKFCGMYMYQGLQTFESKGQCEKAINSVNNKSQPFCGNGICEVGEADDIYNCPERFEKKDGTCEVSIPPSYIGTCLQDCINTFNLSNGRKAEIKIMPETASARAIERLGELNFTIQLKEVGKDNVAYELTTEKEWKMLGLFKVKGKISVEVDAETGDVIEVHKPWWAFLASGI